MDTLPYLEFRIAQAQHGQSASALPESVRAELRNQARQQWLLEQKILSAPQAQGFPLDSASLAQALQTIRDRYPDHESYLADLAAQGLDETLLTQALERESRAEAILAAIAAQYPLVTMQAAEAFYLAHQERFFQPEARQARHILITLNPDLAENTPKVVEQRIAAIAAKLAAAPAQFADEALRNSECPSALQGGELGWVQRGQLYPELDAALFAMQAGEIRIATSPLGQHVLLCETIRPAAVLPFADVAEKLLASLQERQNRKAQAAWLKTL